MVKAGSSLVVEGGPLLLREWMGQVAELRQRFNIRVIWVTSGAIASARQRVQHSWHKLDEKQALSSIGQPMVMDLYNLALQAQGLLGAQVLLTYDDMADRRRKQNLRNTLSRLLEWQIVPVLNENDTVATEEIQFGDNDSLSARVAALMGAKRLVILTNVDGLFDQNPRHFPQARLIHQLTQVTPEILKKVGAGGSSEFGTGGMFSKLKAAQFATRRGVDTWLVRGDQVHTLCRVAQDEKLGTRVKAKRAASKKAKPNKSKS